MGMKERLQYIDKFKKAFDRQDYELLGKMLNELGELRMNYLNTVPIVLLDSIHLLICYVKDIKKNSANSHYNEFEQKLRETIDTILEHLENTSQIMQNFINEHLEKDE
ncbi:MULTISPECIES: hypothetical protein [Photorhabdus]|uniref:Uncharacterized protein n=2 Tax=Photorhabdus asymbiotica TaxID=291112 RepID=B6VMU0_PHOAA|nr:hypothetical protein [Photorhabdus asymbiotica]RKS57679.1 hypothetical protein BDD30_2488 [Photorhabdus asymbiotica]CAQ83009.1 conserved hypothetical protein [Photorhabdus asymbiotica]CAR67470.1 Hypothetical Protein PA-RVA14-1094 [Photorhabdus asymbiotica subsp. asymbiotica ATCC 43949]